MTDKEVRDAIQCAEDRNRERVRASFATKEQDILNIRKQCPHEGPKRGRSKYQTDDDSREIYFCSACGEQLT